MEERVGRNCNGVDKGKLNGPKLWRVRLITFAHYPIDGSIGETEYREWRKCERNIDTYLRNPAKNK
jgi:hypothetical protein